MMIQANQREFFAIFKREKRKLKYPIRNLSIKADKNGNFLKFDIIYRDF